jgi:hypothetical protein
VLANDTDADNIAPTAANAGLTVTAVTQGTNGTVTITGGGTGVSYTPNTNFAGADGFTYTISDGAGGSDTAAVAVTVTSVNDRPVATADSYNVDEGQTLTVAAPGVLVNDVDIEGSPLTAVLATGPAHAASFTLQPNGGFSYTPVAGYSGPDSFVYRSNDGSADSDPATVTIAVAALPALSINDVTVTEGTGVTTPMSFTVSLSAPRSVAVSVNFATANGTALAPADYLASTGTLNFAPGETSKTIAVDVVADALDEAAESFFVNLTGPAGAKLGDGQGVGTITDDDVPPSVSLDDVVVTEVNTGTVAAVFTVALSQASGQTVTVDYATANGTGSAGVDYLASSGVLTFASGTTTQQVTVTVNGDLLDEPDETFLVNLTGATLATIPDGSGTGTIVDNDPAPALSIADASVVEGNAGTTTASFVVTLSAASGRTVTVDFATANGTATAGTDYVAGIGNLTFAPGETTKTIAVTLNGDAIDEVDETFAVNLSNPVNAALADGTAVGTIRNDDAPAVPLTWTQTAYSDFVGGTIGSATYVTDTTGGEVTLRPMRATEFPGAALPSDWILGTTTGITVSGGWVNIDGNRIGPNSTYTVGTGHILEFVATFTNVADQNGGFAFSTTTGPWAWFGTKGDGRLYARTRPASNSTDTAIAGNWLDAPHTFRIDWMSTSVVYRIDGVIVATHNLAINGTKAMRPTFSDVGADARVLRVNYARMGPYTASSGTYATRIFDAGQSANWQNATWTSAVPTGTGLTVSIRTGNTATPDATWTAYAPITSGAALSRTSRYVQFSVTMTTSGGLTTTPELRDLVLTYSNAP